MYIAKVRQRKAHMRAYMRRGRRGAVAHVKVTWHATAANQYRGTVGCVRSRGGSERRRSRGSQCVRGRQPHLVGESNSRETRAHPRTHIYTYTNIHTQTHLSKSTPSPSFDRSFRFRRGLPVAGRLIRRRKDHHKCKVPGWIVRGSFFLRFSLRRENKKGGIEVSKGVDLEGRMLVTRFLVNLFRFEFWLVDFGFWFRG